jgi:hypothetical protein
MLSAFFQLMLGCGASWARQKKSSGKICVEVFFPLTNLLMCDGALCYRRWALNKSEVARMILNESSVETSASPEIPTDQDGRSKTDADTRGPAHSGTASQKCKNERL